MADAMDLAICEKALATVAAERDRLREASRGVPLLVSETVSAAGGETVKFEWTLPEGVPRIEIRAVFVDMTAERITWNK